MDERGKSLYEVLGVAKDASQADIKKAYYKLALQLHPDKNQGDAEASAKFQALQRIYAVLGDAEKRAIYDETGSLQDCEDLASGSGGGGGGAFGELYRYYANVFRRVDDDDIAAFAAKYRGSAEERSDLLRHYNEHAGDMARVFEWVILSRPEVDAHRFMACIDAAIAAGEAERTAAYTRWAKATAARPPPAVDPLAPEPAPGKKGGGGKGKRGGSGDEGALIAAIQAKRGGSFAATLASLEAKYGGGSSGGGGGSGKKAKKANASGGRGDQNGGRGGKRRASPEGAGDSSDGGGEPTEEEFEAARRRIEERRGGGGGASAGAGASNSGGVKKAKSSGGKKVKA